MPLERDIGTGCRKIRKRGKKGLYSKRLLLLINLAKHSIKNFKKKSINFNKMFKGWECIVVGYAQFLFGR
jgi:hypothetical protein